MSQFIRKYSLQIRCQLLLLAVLILAFIFFAVPLTNHVIRQRHLVEEKAKMYTIAYNSPFFPYFSKIVSGRALPDGAMMDGYHFGQAYTFATYYNKAAELFPENDAAIAMMGFCAYYQGQVIKAKTAYKQVLLLNPSFWWAYYNLGVIYFMEGNYNQAKDFFLKAAALKQEESLKTIARNSFYQSIWRDIPDAQQVLVNNLRTGQLNVRLLLDICHKLELNNSDKDLLQTIEKLKKVMYIRIF